MAFKNSLSMFLNVFAIAMQSRRMRCCAAICQSSLVFIVGITACTGPDIGANRTFKLEHPEEAADATLPPAPTLVYPPEGYQTTSNIILIKAAPVSGAQSYQFEALKAGASVGMHTSSSAGTAELLTLPAASYGDFTFRLTYTDAAGKTSAPAIATVNVRNFSAGTLVKAMDFTAQPTCIACSMLLFVSCAPYSYNLFWPPIPPASNCPAFPNDDWTHCQSDAYVSEGNAWTCAAAPEGSLLTNHNVLNTYHPATTGFDYSWQDVSMISESYQMGHTAAATNEALITSCRMKRDSECGSGNDAAISFWYYPYRDATTTDNVYIAQRDCSGTWTTLATARVTAINQIAQSSATKLQSKIDCLGDYFTAYYKSGSNYIPIEIAKDNAKFSGRTGWGFGPGHPTAAILHRVSTFEWRRW